MRRLICCHRRNKDLSLDLDDQERVVTYNGLESILNSYSCDNDTSNISGTSRADEDTASSCSSSKDATGSSFSSKCLISGKLEEEEEEQGLLHSLHNMCVKKGKAPISYTMHFSDVEAMKERFAKLLLGEDVSGGNRGISTALALSNAIANLSATIFGEMWKLEPLSEERKCRWHMEMDWLLSPTNYMVELVPATQNGENGVMLEIMTPKARTDVHVNLPALQKLDSMLIDVLDSMESMEFWYGEGGNRGQNGGYTKLIKKWWLPSPQVPDSGLSTSQRKKLIFHGKFVHQVLKAAKSINEQVLLQLPIPSPIIDALPKSGKASLGEELYQAITTTSFSVQELFMRLNLRSEHRVLDTVNRLEGAIFAWKQNLFEEDSKRMSPLRSPWHFMKDNGLELEKIRIFLERAETLHELVKNRFPNLPQSFIDVTKVQYNKDVGHAIVEAYSRAIVGIAFKMLSRIGDILQEDEFKKPTTPISNVKFDFFSDVYLAGITETPPGHICRSLIDQMNRVDGRFYDGASEGNDDCCFLEDRAQVVTVTKRSSFKCGRGKLANFLFTH